MSTALTVDTAKKLEEEVLRLSKIYLAAHERQKDESFIIAESLTKLIQLASQLKQQNEGK